MYGARESDERFDPLGLEVPFAERPETAETPSFGSQLDLGEATFATTPTDEVEDRAGEGLSWLGSAVQTAETEAAEASPAEWLEAEWLEAPASAGLESVDAFAERLGREWSRRRNGDPTPEAMRAWLIQDHEDTQAGARLRWASRRVSPDFWTRVTNAWKVSREEQMRYQTEPQAGVAPLGGFAPPTARVELISDPLVEGSDKAPVAPLTARFARELRRRFGAVHQSNYRGHGGGAFLNRGYSLDLFLNGRDARGFYRRDDAIRLLRAVDAAARAVGAAWRVIYNDFSVAEAINSEFRRRHVVFVGAVLRDRAKRATGLNWHGPDPLILHFHLDLAPLADARLAEAETSELDETAQPLCAACRGAHRASDEAEWGPLDRGEAPGDTFEADQWQGEEREEEHGRFDPPESETEWLGEALEAAPSAAAAGSPLAAAGLTPAERKALEITSTLETGKRGGFFGLSGNFDGQGLSFGLVNWTIGTGSLQPLLRDFAREQPARWSEIFGRDAERFRALIAPTGDAAVRAQHRFAVEEMNEVRVVNGRKRWAIRQPWRDYFWKLSEDPAFRAIQLRYVRDLLARAAFYCRLFHLRSEQAFAFMFDAVSSHGKWWLTKKLGGEEKRRLMIEARLRPLRMIFGEGHIPESDLLLIIADVLAETSAARWAEKVRARKRWFVTGEHPRARELAGVAPRADAPWTASTPGEVREDREELAWLDFEAGRGAGDRFEVEAEANDQEADSLSYEGDAARTGAPEWRPSPMFAEAMLGAEGEAALSYEQEWRPTPAACTGYPPGYEKLIRRKGSTEGKVVDRTEGDRSVNLALQLQDYDVNAYLPVQKASHREAMLRITEFIQARVAAGAEVAVTITGAASRTGTQAFNQELSEKRAGCMAEFLRTSLSDRGLLERTRIDPHGEGFTHAVCEGADCELPAYRSVLISVHAPGRRPDPTRRILTPGTGLRSAAARSRALPLARSRWTRFSSSSQAGCRGASPSSLRRPCASARRRSSDGCCGGFRNSPASSAT